MYANNQSALNGSAGYGVVAKDAMLSESIKRIPELPAAMDNMERAANFLHDSINELSARLDGVLRPATPEPTNPQQIGIAPPSSGYASTIHGQAARVTMIAERVQDLLRRLEV